MSMQQKMEDNMKGDNKLPAMAAAAWPLQYRQHGIVIPNRIFVSGMEDDMTEDDLTRIFSIYGCVKSSRIIYNSSGYTKGYGFVTFLNVYDAQRLQSQMHYIIVGDRKLYIGPAIKKQPILGTNGVTYYGYNYPPHNMVFNPYAVPVMQAPAFHTINYNIPSIQYPRVLQDNGVPMRENKVGAQDAIKAGAQNKI